MLGQLGNDPWLGTGPAGEPKEEQRVPARVRSVGYNGYLDRLASQQALAAPGDGGDRGAAAAGDFCPAGPAVGAQARNDAAIHVVERESGGCGHAMIEVCGAGAG